MVGEMVDQMGSLLVAKTVDLMVLRTAFQMVLQTVDRTVDLRVHQTAAAKVRQKVSLVFLKVVQMAVHLEMLGLRTEYYWVDQLAFLMAAHSADSKVPQKGAWMALQTADMWVELKGGRMAALLVGRLAQQLEKIGSRIDTSIFPPQEHTPGCGLDIRPTTVGCFQKSPKS